MVTTNALNITATGIVKYDGVGAFTATTTTNHAVLIGSTSNAITNVGPVASTGAVLQSNGVGSDPGFSTATYPSIATGTGTILRADGSNWVATTATYPATTTINQIVYSSAKNILAGITAANNGTMISSATGVPSWLANGTTGQLLTATTGSPPSWTTIVTGGDVVGPGSATDNALARFDGTTGKLIQNGVITQDDTGNLSITASVSGATLSETISNTSNTASSNALSQHTVAGTSAGDPFATFTVAGTTNWSLGADNSVTGDPFVVAASTALGTTNIMSALTSGEINYPLQPAFLGNLNSTALNKTGNGATYTLGTDALTEIFDQGSDFTTAGVFTAPVTGRYHLNASIILSGCTINSNTVVTLVSSNRSYAMANGHGPTAQDNGCAISHLCDMDAADTCTVTVLAVGEAGDTDDVAAGAKFSGYLEC